jgi:ParB family chromosome partitioning protein
MATPASSSQNQKNRPRLGRGLSSLISVSDLPVEQEIPNPVPAPPAGAGDTPVPVATAEPRRADAGQAPSAPGVLEIEVDRIAPNPHQPRRVWNDANLAELAGSLKASGMIQPVIVRKTAKGFELIAGERRLRAARLAGLAKIPAIVKEVDAATQAQMALIENIQREDLNPVDRALGYRTLMDQLGLTQMELAERLGEDRSSIANYLRVLDLADSLREFLRSGQLSMGHAKLLAGVSDILEQERLGKLAAERGMSVRELENLLRNPGSTPSAKPVRSAHLVDLERSLSRQLGMRVQVRAGRKGNRGKLVIHYSNLDQFDDVIAKLGLKVE